MILMPLVVGPRPGHSALSLSRSEAHRGDVAALSLLFSGFSAQTLAGGAADAIALRNSSASSSVSEAQPLDDGSAGALGREGRVVSIPYLILATCACVATAMVHCAPDGTESMYDTVAQADEALDSARSCGSRHSSRDGTGPERRRLRAPSCRCPFGPI